MCLGHWTKRGQTGLARGRAAAPQTHGRKVGLPANGIVLRERNQRHVEHNHLKGAVNLDPVRHRARKEEVPVAVSAIFHQHCRRAPQPHWSVGLGAARPRKEGPLAHQRHRLPQRPVEGRLGVDVKGASPRPARTAPPGIGCRHARRRFLDGGGERLAVPCTVGGIWAKGPRVLVPQGRARAEHGLAVVPHRGARHCLLVCDGRRLI